MQNRIWPALSLFVLSPLIAEYLLGSLPASLIVILPLMAAMYGSGAILIREIVRRTGRGWPSIILLATAYGLFEEGFVTQSLFNPNYLHLRLLDFGFLPLLGTALPWLIFVISIHVIWSISVPIALTEALFKLQRDTPWLGKISGGVYLLIFLAGSALVARFSYQQVPFLATPAQFGVTGAVIIMLCIVALRWPKHVEVQTGELAPRPWLLFLSSFIAGSLLMGLQQLAVPRLHLSWQTGVAILIAIEALFIAFMVFATRGKVWDAPRRFTLMAGAFMVYVWVGFNTDINLHGAADLPGHTVIAVICCAVLAIAGWRVFSKHT